MSGMPAARMTDPVAGSIIAMGSPTVLIGPTPQAQVLQVAAARGTPFCARCKELADARAKAEAKNL